MTDSMLVINGTVITWERDNRVLPDHAVYVQDGLIHDLGPQAELIGRYPQAARLDAAGQYIMPGNICAHTHYYGAFARGMAIPGTAPKDFPEILAKLWWPLDKALDLDDVYYSALVCLIDAVRHGTTTLIDHHASPNAIDGSLDAIARAVAETGLRSVLCYEVTDRDGPAKARAGIEENVRFLKRVRSGDNLDGRLGAMFGLHASLTLSDATLTACREAAAAIGDDVGFHIHVAEHPADEYDAVAKTGTRAVDRLYRLGILGPRSIAVHCVHVDAREIALLAESGTWVSHQPRSNMNNGVGLPPVESLLRAGVKVCLGNDGFTNLHWEEWKAAYLGHKLWHQDPRRMSALAVAEMGVYHNAELAGLLLPGAPLGVLQKGARADLILVDYHPFTPLTAGNLPWHIVFGFHESMITTTIAAGKVLMQNRQLLALDEERIAAEARRRAPEVWKRYQAVAEAEG